MSSRPSDHFPLVINKELRTVYTESARGVVFTLLLWRTQTIDTCLRLSNSRVVCVLASGDTLRRPATLTSYCRRPMPGFWWPDAIRRAKFTRYALLRWA